MHMHRWGELHPEATNTHLALKADGSSTEWPFGHLTNLGAQQLRNLGSKLRERYANSASSSASLPGHTSYLRRLVWNENACLCYMLGLE
jgi:hypothetical protein